MKKKLSASKLSLIIILELLIGLGASIFSFFAFILLAVNIETLHIFDVFLNELIYNLRSDGLTSVMLVITYFGHEVLLAFLAALFLILVIKKHGRTAIIFILIVGVGVCLNLLLKEIVGRNRPTLDPIIDENFYSFPSGHAMNAFVFYSMLVLYVYRFSRNVRLTFTSLILNGALVLLIGFSRIYLGVHYVSDVLAGFIAGLWWIATALVIEKTLPIFWKKNKRAT